MNASLCLITPGHLASSPRVVKEAEALVAAGYQVRVVAGRYFDPVEALDSEIMATAKWQVTRLDYRRGVSAFARKSMRLLARCAFGRLRTAVMHLAVRAHHAESFHLGVVASKNPADLYLGHCLAGLPAAAHAARRRGTRFAFDAEDFHDSETLEACGNGVDARLPPLLQAALLPKCAHITASSPLIGGALEQKYRVRTVPVLNVFPLAQAPRAPVVPEPISDATPARVYWFSQTIGPGRGLEAAVAVLSQLRTPVELQLRGFVSDCYKTQLSKLARDAGLARSIAFLPPAPPSEMPRLAASAHLGLSCEESTPLNRDLCLTNKIFAYLLAGLPQLLTPTSAQRALAAELGDAAVLFDVSRPAATAACVDSLLTNSAQLAAARAAAWKLGQTRFNWEFEGRRVVEVVRSSLTKSR